jgi:hypothetical protein
MRKDGSGARPALLRQGEGRNYAAHSYARNYTSRNYKGGSQRTSRRASAGKDRVYRWRVANRERYNAYMREWHKRRRDDATHAEEA